MFNPLFAVCVKNRSRIIFVFKILYLLLLTFLFIGGWSIYTNDANAFNYYQLALVAARTAIIVYILTTIPGITKRFGLSHRLIQIIMLFRRYLGITVFLLVLIHFWFVRGIALFFQKVVILPRPLFETFGMLSYMLLFFMFVTSNDFSVKRLGIWWYYIHKVTFVIVWLIFLHVALQRFSIWTVLIGLTALFQVTSHLYSFIKKRSVQAVVQ